MAQAAIIEKCNFCDSEQDVNYFCTDCEELLCSKCKVGHAKSKKTKNDIIISLKQAREDGIVHKPTTIFCNEHSSVEVTLFCLMCNQLVCTQCLAGQHMKHQVTIPDEVKELKTQELRNNIKILKEKKAIFENAFDIEGKAHILFSKSIDEVRKDITDQKAKLIEELNLLCKEQFSELTVLQQNEDKRYSDACSKIHIQNQAVTMALQTAESSITGSNTSIIIQATVDTTRTLHGIEEPDIPPTTVATYEHGEKTRSSILQVQGKIDIRQTETASYHACGTGRPTDRKTLKKINTEKTPKAKLDTHQGKLQKQKTTDDNKQQRPDVDKLRIDVSKVRIKSTVKVRGKYYIYVIVPLQNKTAWVHTDSDHYMTMVDSRGKIITTSVSLGHQIYDAKQYRRGLLVTCYNHCKLHNLSEDGKSISTFSDFSPYHARGLCVTRDTEVMVCLYNILEKDNKVVILNASGHIMQTLQRDVTGAPLYHDLYRVALLTTGEVIVRDGNKIMGVDRKGKRLFTWEGEMQGRKIDDYRVGRITHDSNNNLFVTDYMHHRVFVLDKDGSGGMCLIDSTQGVEEPWGIAVDKEGQLWVGCFEGNIHIIKY